MAEHDLEAMFEEAKRLIIEKKLFFVEDVVALLPIHKATFYKYYPLNSNELNELKELMSRNKVEVKSAMRSKWFKSDNPTLQVALMKLIGTEEEAHRLNGSNHKISGDKDNPLQNQLTITINHATAPIRLTEHEDNLLE